MSNNQPSLIPGYETRQFLNQPEKMPEARWATPLAYCRFIAEDTARRIEASRELFSRRFFRGDCHSHTQHSDGIGTVAETAAMSRAAGLDFQFVTDHWGITQAPECREHGLWYGQEPVTRHHHLGILGLEHAFAPQNDFLADYHAAVAAGATVFVPHPCGWWPNTRYNDEQKKLLEELPSPFLMEICNGADNIISAFDVTDDDAIALWDHLLCLDFQVHALGNTDAHAPHGIGMVWNAVFAETCDQATILAELSRGHGFVSDGPLIHISLGSALMGDIAGPADRAEKLRFHVVDSRGLAGVTIVADGEIIYDDPQSGLDEIRGVLKVPAAVQHYIRLEARGVDGRRAYSNPIYFRG